MKKKSNKGKVHQLVGRGVPTEMNGRWFIADWSAEDQHVEHYHCWDTISGNALHCLTLQDVAHAKDVHTYASRNGASKKLKVLRERSGIPHVSDREFPGQVLTYSDLMTEHGCAACICRHASQCRLPPFDDDVSGYVTASLAPGSPKIRPNWCPWPAEGNNALEGWKLPSETEKVGWKEAAMGYRHQLVKLKKLITDYEVSWPSPIKALGEMQELWAKLERIVNGLELGK